MAFLIVTCRCGQEMKVRENAIGHKCTCPGCQKRVKINKKNTRPFEATPAPIPQFEAPSMPLQQTAGATSRSPTLKPKRPATPKPNVNIDDALRALSLGMTNILGPTCEICGQPATFNKELSWKQRHRSVKITSVTSYRRAIHRCDIHRLDSIICPNCGAQVSYYSALSSRWLDSSLPLTLLDGKLMLCCPDCSVVSMLRANPTCDRKRCNRPARALKRRVEVYDDGYRSIRLRCDKHAKLDKILPCILVGVLLAIGALAWYFVFRS